MRIKVLGVAFDSITMAEAMAEARRLMSRRDGAYVVTPNPEMVWLCRDEPDIGEAVANASLVLPDGVGIVYGAKILGTPLAEKVPGIDFAMGLMGELANSGGSVFLLGGRPGVAERAALELNGKYPDLDIKGTQDGYFSDEEAVIEKINSASPDFLLVCLGMGKQELFMRRNAGRLKTGLMAGLGGTLDVLAGETKRAPEGWRRLGLEWLYRLLKEPSRIGRMAKLPLFLLAVVRERFSEKPQSEGGA